MKPSWIAAAIVFVVVLPTRAADAPPAKPNFVVILADDLGYGDIGSYGSTLNRTPALDRMAAEGMRLASFYAAPVCTPSRAQIMTGCYAKRVSMPNVIFPACPTGLNPAESTIATLLRKRGYATMCIGKWHLGDQPEFLPTRHGFDHYFGLPYSNDMGPGEAAAKAAAEGKARPAGRPPLPLVRDASVVRSVSPSDQDELTRLYTEEAVAFIRENKDRPFFLYFPHTAVHVPLHPGPAHKGKSQNGAYGDWVEEVDGSVGTVLDAIRELKLDARTMVVFTSDNGPWLTQGKNGGVAGPLRDGKGTTWEGGVREPTVAWWPGRVPAGTTCDAAASEMDLLPTLVKLAGGEVPTDRPIDGKDIWPLLSGQSRQPPHKALYYFKGIRLEAVRSGPWKLAIVNQGASRGVPKEAGAKAVAKGPFTPLLFNLEKDLGETTDVAAANPDVVERLQALVKKMDEDLGVTGQGPGVRPPGRVEKPEPLIGHDGKVREGLEAKR